MFNVLIFCDVLNDRFRAVISKNTNGNLKNLLFHDYIFWWIYIHILDFWTNWNLKVENRLFSRFSSERYVSFSFKYLINIVNIILIFELHPNRCIYCFDRL